MRIYASLFAAAMMVSPATSAVKIGYVSISNGNIADFSDLADQFPGTIVSINGSVAFKGTYPTQESCAIGFTDPNTPCGGGLGTFPIEAFGPVNLDDAFSTGSTFGRSGIEEADFWTAYDLTNGDTIVTTFRRITPGTWTSPTPNAVPGARHLGDDDRRLRHSRCRPPS